MVSVDIEKKVIALITGYSGTYSFRKQKYDIYTAESSIHFDVRLDVDEFDYLMDEYFLHFNVDKESFNISTYYPDVPVSLNPFKKTIIDIPELTIGMLIESAKAGKWLYE
ncbi:DUF1493 family protein [Erwinia sp.]|uniref:DUF1493 family protein n=1 Tax=Erwinia citreus TaxID=558 RepID=UPI003C75B9F9